MTKHPRPDTSTATAASPVTRRAVPGGRKRGTNAQPKTTAPKPLGARGVPTAVVVVRPVRRTDDKGPCPPVLPGRGRHRTASSTKVESFERRLGRLEEVYVQLGPKNEAQQVIFQRLVSRVLQVNVCLEKSE